MRILIQRVNHATVRVDGSVTGEIGRGLLLLVGLGLQDRNLNFQPIIDKITRMRIFPSDKSDSAFDCSVSDIAGGILVVSQFTLYADLSSGRRPSFSSAMPPSEARVIYADFVDAFRKHYTNGPVAEGLFGKHMKIDFENDGPVTIMLDSELL